MEELIVIMEWNFHKDSFVISNNLYFNNEISAKEYAKLNGIKEDDYKLEKIKLWQKQQ